MVRRTYEGTNFSKTNDRGKLKRTYPFASRFRLRSVSFVHRVLRIPREIVSIKVRNNATKIRVSPFREHRGGKPNRNREETVDNARSIVLRRAAPMFSRFPRPIHRTQVELRGLSTFTSDRRPNPVPSGPSSTTTPSGRILGREGKDETRSMTTLRKLRRFESVSIVSRGPWFPRCESTRIKTDASEVRCDGDRRDWNRCIPKPTRPKRDSRRLNVEFPLSRYYSRRSSED